ncbi:MAG TPA: serine/threonine-protein kinase [Polyangia bacterium]|jgi:hypothetical protein|nr:serine/threonine-protein kinase [Polyangia bacterium]
MSSSKKRSIGAVLTLAGAAIAAFAFRVDVRPRGDGDKARVDPAAAQDSSNKEAADRKALEDRALVAAGTKPLNAALENNVDGPTLVDLFDSEDWWKAYREEFVATRVIVGAELLAAHGKIDIGSSDSAVVKEARRQKVSSAPVTIGGQTFLIAAARLPSLADREPVLVLLKKIDPPPVAVVVRPPAAPARSQNQGIAFWVGAGFLCLAGISLLLSGRKPANGNGNAAVAGSIIREDTLRFGTPSKPQPRAESKVLRAASIPRVTGVAARGTGVGQAPTLTAAARPTTSSARPSPQPAAAEAEADDPNIFGRYKLIDRLGEGGMSEIYTAVAYGVEGFSRTFVLKRLKPELARDKEAVAQFIDEARMQATLVHSNIVPVFDFGMVGQEYFMTQEYILGRDLVRLMSRYYDQTKRALEPRVAYYIAHETLAALSYAHGKHERDGEHMGIVHRDVSAANIMVSLQGEVKLFDFGIVKANRRVTRTQVGMVKGNANFMSPEQARGHNVDARSDLFSLALVLYYCLTNELLYDGANDLDVLYRAATGPTQADYEKLRQLPEPAAQILEKALAFDPDERFQSSNEFASMLAAHIGGGKSDASNLMQLLFGDELRKEAA